MLAYVKDTCKVYRTLLEYNDLKKKQVTLHETLLFNKNKDDAPKMRENLLNCMSARNELKSVNTFSTNKRLKNLIGDSLEKLVKGERVMNKLHDGAGPLAQMDITLVDFDLYTEDIINDQVLPFHSIILMGCKSVAIAKDGESSEGKNAVTISAGDLEAQKDLSEKYTNPTGEEWVGDEETLVYGFTTTGRKQKAMGEDENKPATG